MPQMFPMYWVVLMFYFIFMMMFLMTFIYFSYFNISKKYDINVMELQFSWMW